MNAKRHLVITTSGGDTKTYTVPPRVEVKFERTMKMAMSDIKKSEDIYRLSWLAAVDAGDVSTDSFDAWLETVEGIDWVQGDAPLEPDPASGTSLPLPSNPG